MLQELNCRLILNFNLIPHWNSSLPAGFVSKKQQIFQPPGVFREFSGSSLQVKVKCDLNAWLSMQFIRKVIHPPGPGIESHYNRSWRKSRILDSYHELFFAVALCSAFLEEGVFFLQFLWLSLSNSKFKRPNKHQTRIWPDWFSYDQKTTSGGASKDRVLPSSSRRGW